MKLYPNKSLMAIFLTSSLVFSIGMFKSVDPEKNYFMGENIDKVLENDDDYTVYFTDDSYIEIDKDNTNNDKVKVVDDNYIKNLSIFTGLAGMTTTGTLLLINKKSR